MRLPWQKRPAPVPEAEKAFSRRLDDLADDVAHLARRLDKLQGRVTGGLRDTEKPEPAPGVPLTITEYLRRLHAVPDGNGRSAR